ncbi:MAG: AlpA family phage regulatory protein [Gemmatimonadetes bacterium]|nr:AlpA family phage regulatory protein [Gemmatimonadota bacterium]MYA41496.1 AlpA family phage regulatory protein [Gemmatimonadota bacterium]MYD15200.1 AlpA family phage regulatory protein [Gemmatimonadota bacterium]MYE94064.1 AlpA family phage regulatory protein [Gemmatimonadota bacterium]MYJ12159.1 AlpA family phage regulatory protein [Gemmatimonadota bacterium]
MAKAHLNLREVEDETGLNRSTIYRQMKAGKFPKPDRLTTRRVGWRREDIKAWQDSRKSAEYPK